MINQLPDDVRGALRDEAVPAWRAPSLATLSDKRFFDPEWIFERKSDGERCLAFRDGDRVQLLSRKRQSLSATYPDVVDALAKQDTSGFVIDGEIVAFEGRHTSFTRLQGRLGITDPEKARASRIPVFYYLFDLLHLDGQATSRLPLIWRKRLLHNAFEFHDPLRYTTHRAKEGEAAYRATGECGDEGVIAKRAAAKYDGRRSANWLKFKCARDQEFVIGGYTAPEGSRVALGALLVGYHEGRDLVYAGKVGTGFDDETLRSLHKRMSGIEQHKPPFTRGQIREPGAHWVHPKLVAQAAFTEWTRDGKLHHRRYTGLRTDKNADEVIRETS